MTSLCQAGRTGALAWLLLAAALAPPVHVFAAAEPTSKDDARLKQALTRFPAADANGDGVLTQAEAQAFLKARKQGGAGKSATPSAGALKPSQTVMVPMRDGARLATDVYQPEGKGPWPAIAHRTPYNRQAAQHPGAAAGFVGRGYAYVVQDWRGQFGSEGKYDTLRPELNQHDGYDTVEWIAAQSWCNGKVGMVGGSGPGIAALQAAMADPPHLVAVVAGVGSAFPEERQMLSGGVMLSQSAQWLAKRGMAVSEWPRPSTWIVDQVLTPPNVAPSTRPTSTPNHVALLHHGGWFDIFGDAPLTQLAHQDKGRSRAIMGPTGHGGRVTDLPFPDARPSGPSQAEWLDFWLKGEPNGALDGPPIRYYLMGDARNPKAPGNVWKSAESWPVPHRPVPFYLRQDGLLTPLPAPASETGAARSYASDPRDPVRTLGGAIMGSVQGPVDQRPLMDRGDIVRFVTGPLEAPFEITGNVLAEFWVSSDSPDTTFMVKLLDVYPDGYEALILDSAIMARYRDGFAAPAPLEAGRPYRLTVQLGSTALVFDRGHKIGVHVASSNAPKFEVHPNTFAPVASYDEARIARNTLHLSPEYPSRLIVPQIASGDEAK
jgi:predicted acyl esterase